MLVPGDLIQWQGKRWLVYKIESGTQTAFASSQDNEMNILGAEEDTTGACQVLCNPTTLWPATTLPPKRGRLLGLYKATLRGEVPLVWLVDWARMDPMQMGGSIFLSPELGLTFPDRLIATYDTGRTPVDIPRVFVPAPQRTPPRPKTTSVAPSSANLYDHLRDEDE